MTVKILGKHEKQPREIIDYDVIYDDWFEGRTEAPLSFTYEVVRLSADPDDPTPPAASLLVPQSQLVGNTVKLVVSGGAARERYKLTVLLTTTPVGLVKEADFILTIKEV